MGEISFKGGVYVAPVDTPAPLAEKLSKIWQEIGEARATMQTDEGWVVPEWLWRALRTFPGLPPSPHAAQRTRSARWRAGTRRTKRCATIERKKR